MDRDIVERLGAAGMDPSFKSTVITIPIEVDDDRQPVPAGERISVISGEIVVPEVRLKKITELFTGDRKPPVDEFAKGPTPEYQWFFILIERTAMDFCSCTDRIERDVEFERLYRHLRRRPDGRDTNPLFSYLQAAARLYMSLRDVSQAEFEAVVNRLALSAKRFSQGPTSRNYCAEVSKYMGLGRSLAEGSEWQ